MLIPSLFPLPLTTLVRIACAAARRSRVLLLAARGCRRCALRCSNSIATALQPAIPHTAASLPCPWPPSCHLAAVCARYRRTQAAFDKGNSRVRAFGGVFASAVVKEVQTLVCVVVGPDRGPDTCTCVWTTCVSCWLIVACVMGVLCVKSGMIQGIS